MDASRAGVFSAANVSVQCIRCVCLVQQVRVMDVSRAGVCLLQIQMLLSNPTSMSALISVPVPVSAVWMFPSKWYMCMHIQ